VPVDTTAYKLNGSLPVVGTSTAVFAAIGNPVEVITPEPQTNEAALELISTPSLSGAGPLVNIAVAVVPVATRPQRFGDSRLGESVLAVWQAVTDSIPVPRTTVCAGQSMYLDSLHKMPRRYQDNGAGRQIRASVHVRVSFRSCCRASGWCRPRVVLDRDL
jgi:hypothetical protein